MRTIDLVQNPGPNQCHNFINGLSRHRFAQEIEYRVLELGRVMPRDVFKRLGQVMERS